MIKYTNRRNVSVTLAATAGLLLAGAAVAKPSQPSEIRGYQSCLTAAEQQTKPMRTTRRYLLQTSDSGRAYFINAYQWQNGERVAVHVTCSTSRNGHKVHNVAVNEGSYDRQNSIAGLK